MTGSLIFERPPRLRDRDGLYSISVDDRPVGRLENDASFEVPVAPGQHSVEIRIDWKRSRRRIDVPDGTRVKIQIAPRRFAPTLWSLLPGVAWFQIRTFPASPAGGLE